MSEYWSFLHRLRHDLGKRFTVAEEHTPESHVVNVFVLRQRRDDVLSVKVDARWLALLGHTDTPTLRVEYKHLVIAVRSFFTHPDRLAPASFYWPGTPESREALRHTLNPRRRARAS